MLLQRIFFFRATLIFLSAMLLLKETLAELRLFRCEASASDDTLSLSEDGVSSRMLGRLGAVPYTSWWAENPLLR